MTPLIIATALGLLALDAAPATSPPNTVSPVSVNAPPKPDAVADADKVICRNEPLTGSRFNKRVCMTRAGWDEQQQKVEEFERRINQTPTPMGGGGMSGK